MLAVYYICEGHQNGDSLPNLSLEFSVMAKRSTLTVAAMGYLKTNLRLAKLRKTHAFRLVPDGRLSVKDVVDFFKSHGFVHTYNEQLCLFCVMPAEVAEAAVAKV